MPLRGVRHLPRESDKELPASLPRWFLRPRLFFPAILLIGLAAFFWPARQLRSDNFVFYFPSGHRMLPLESVGGAKYLPLLQILNLVGKVGGIQEKKNSLKVWFGSTQIELRANNTKVQINKASYDLPQPVHVTDGQWMVPVDFLTTVLPHLTHQAVEYQEGTNRIFLGDVKPASFTVRVDPIANGARLTVQFTDKVAVRTASSNGKWVMFLGDHPMEPMEPSYRFENPYLSELQYDDQDGEPKLILSPTSSGLNFYPVQTEGGKILLADVLKPPPTSAQALPLKPPPTPSPASAPPTPAGPTPQAAEASPAAPPGPPLPVVALDAGHGGEDNGGHSHDGVLEKDLVAQYVARVRSALLATDKYRVVLSRTGDVNVSSEQRALAANLSGAICFLSFHAGDLGTASPRIAIFTFQPPTAAASAAGEAPTPTFVPWAQVQEVRLGQSSQFALALQQQFALINGVDADPTATAPVRTLRNVNAPAVAIELGRLAPDTDATALTNPAFQQQVAGAVVQALASFEKGGN
ncbi:MAG TPA: N-acetylmuramoyl-L-alanine amidase [Terriglobia bacterium]|nr:N-acetylmuramoyl-L-alanine amidase [Terriglobia bacterium]